MSAKLDLLLINPGSRLDIYQALANNLTAIEPPVWGGLMATFVAKKGFSVDILDAEVEGLTLLETAKRVSEISPVLTAVVVYGHQPSASTQNMTSAGAICTSIKKLAPEQKILLVGGHVAALPERTLREEEADFVSSGEGLFTLIELIQALKSNEPDNFQKVRGLWYRDGETLNFNPSAPLLQDLETEMPGIAWDLLPMDKYVAHNWHCFGRLERKPYAAIYTTLGCPYHCSFCCIQAPFRNGEKALGYKETFNSYRYWSPQCVIREIDILVRKYKVRNIKIADEMFVLNMKHVEGICDLIIERGYDLNIWAYARIDTVKENTLEKLKKAGIHWLAFGIEAGSERVRNNVQKRFEQEDIFKTIQAVKAAGIHVIGNYIFGLPEDDLDSMKETLQMALELNCEFANFYSTMAYPGSQLYDDAVRQALPLPEKWSGYSQHAEDTLPLPTKYISAGEVLAFRDNAFHEYFTSPGYLRLVAEKFGSKTENHIKEMVKFRLKRKYASAQPASVA